MQQFSILAITVTMAAALAVTAQGQNFDDAAQLAFEDMLIDDAIEGDLPAFEEDFGMFEDMADAPAAEELPRTEPDPYAPGPPPAVDEDALLDMLSDWDEDADSPDRDVPDWTGELEATPQPPAEPDDDELSLLGLDETAEVVPAEPELPLPEDDEAVEWFADDPVFDDVDVAALEALAETPVDEPPADPDPTAVVDVTPIEVPVDDPAEPEPTDVVDVAPIELPVDDPEPTPEPEPEAVAETPPVIIKEPSVEPPVDEPEVVATVDPEPVEPEAEPEPPPPYEDPMALDEALVSRLVHETKTILDSEDLEGFEKRRAHELRTGPVERTGWLGRLLGR